MKREIITKIDPKSPVSEVFRALRTNMQYINKTPGAQSMLLTSTMQGEGKSWIASNLAVTFAQAGKNVILIDADMRRPRLNTLFGIDMFPGLSNYLSKMSPNGTARDVKIKECVRETEIENLYIIPAGNIPPNPSELLSSDKLIKMINELKKIFDIIIFDGAPCLLVTDATLISRLVDSTIIVTSSGKTKVDDLKDAKKRIERVGGHIAGVVLNRVKVSNKKYENRYYYSNENNDLPMKESKTQLNRNNIEIKNDNNSELKIEKNTRNYNETIANTRTYNENISRPSNIEIPKKTKSVIIEDNPDDVPEEKMREIIEQINKFNNENN